MVAETHDATAGGAGVSARTDRPPITSLPRTAMAAAGLFVDICLRLLAGAGIGAPAAGGHLGDPLPPKHRRVAYALSFLNVPLAGLLARGPAPEAPLGVAGWRRMFGALGPMFVARRGGPPESPRRPASGAARRGGAPRRAGRAEEAVERFERRAGAALPERGRALEAVGPRAFAGTSFAEPVMER